MKNLVRARNRSLFCFFSIFSLLSFCILSCQGTVTPSGASTDDTLSALSISANGSAVALSPGFAAGTTSYTASVAYSTSSVTVAATAANSGATISGVGDVSLSTGTNTISVVVTAADGTTKATYTVVVTRSATKSTDAKLSGLSISRIATFPLDTTFSSDKASYTASVPNSASSVIVSALARNEYATISGLGSVSLPVGTTTVSVVVTAEDGSTKQTYTIAVTRAPANPTDSSLYTLSLAANSNAVALSPSFASATTSYTASVPFSASSVNVAASATEAGASTAGIGMTDLSVGDNTITITVTNTTSVSTYTITVTRAAPSSDASLSSLAVYANGSPLTLNQSFSSDTLDYSVNVPNAIKSAFISASPADSRASVSTTDVSSLNVFSNSASVTVTAEDGTHSIYRITITRAPAFSDYVGTYTSRSSGAIFVVNSDGSIVYTPSSGSITMSGTITVASDAYGTAAIVLIYPIPYSYSSSLDSLDLGDILGTRLSGDPGSIVGRWACDEINIEFKDDMTYILNGEGTSGIYDDSTIYLPSADQPTILSLFKGGTKYLKVRGEDLFNWGELPPPD
jgi:hypothetical protein